MDHLGYLRSPSADFSRSLVSIVGILLVLTTVWLTSPENEEAKGVPNMAVLESQLDKSTLLVMRDSSVQVIQKINAEAGDFYHSNATVKPVPHSLRYSGTTSVEELRDLLKKGGVQAVISPDHPRYEKVAAAFVQQKKIDLSQ